MKIDKILLVLGVIFFSLQSIISAQPNEKFNYIAPSEIPFVSSQMRTPGFWISRHANPDQFILNAEKITALNVQIQNELKLTTDIFSIPTIKGEGFRNELDEILEGIIHRGLYRADGRKLMKTCVDQEILPDACAPVADFFDPMVENMNLKEISKTVKQQFGFIVAYASQRFLPTTEVLTAEANDIDFDELQNSALDLGTPVVVLHETKDSQWLYVVSSASSGWVSKKDVAFCVVEDVKKFFEVDSKGVVISAKADIFLDEALTKYVGFVQMGTVLPLMKTEETKVQVQIPVKKLDGTLEVVTGYLNREDISVGFLAYTPRQIFKQAFKMLDRPYGWGGMYGEQDCSRFIQQIFATVGISLPRDSRNQVKVGNLLAEFTTDSQEIEKREALKSSLVGATILPLKGHIMFYLGSVDDRFYAIHAVWGYRQNIDGEDVVRVLNRVVVSDLSLGEGSKKGSLLNRLVGIRILNK